VSFEPSWTRRVLVAIVLSVCLQVAMPAPAQAWFGWLDQLSGPGPSKGFHWVSRLICVVEEESTDAAVKLTVKASGLEASTTTSWRRVSDAWKRAAREWEEVGGDLRARFQNQKAAAVTADKAAAATTSPDSDQWKTAANAWMAYATAFQKAHELNPRRPDPTQKITSAAFGIVSSACGLERGERRRASFDLGIRLLSFTDQSPTNPYAGGNTIKLTTLEPSFSWTVFSDPRYDMVDAGVGAGVYWFSSDGAKAGGFRAFKGIILEPMRFDIHAPSSVAGTKWWWTAIPLVRLGWDIFPAGFDANAFGPRLIGEKAQRIPAHLVGTRAIFVDWQPIIDQLRRHHR
jgi:hypothetical protein